MTEDEIKEELIEVCKWSSVSGDKLQRLYSIYRIVFNDHSHLCNRCPTVIRRVFNKVKSYKETKYGK